MIHIRILFLLITVIPVLLPGAAINASEVSEMAQLRAMLMDQQRQLNELRAELMAQKSLTSSAPVAVRTVETVQSDAPATPPAGFRASGDFMYIFDVQARAGNTVSGPLQNVRNRYRLRLNLDKALSPSTRFHLQLSTGPANNQVSATQDFAGVAVKAPFLIGEAWMNYSPNRYFAFRVGRMEEVFADGSRFLLDDNLRLNGFEEVIRLPLGRRGIFSQLELRSGEYVLTNPNVPVLAANSPLVAAGYLPGKRVGAADLFHPGLVLSGTLNENWSHRVTFGMQIYRNANQIQLASTLAGAASAGDSLGLGLSGPLSESGNATTTPGGAMYAAEDFRVAHLGYRLNGTSVFRMRGKAVPGYVDLQVSRNVGTDRLKDAVMGTVSLGAVRKFGDVRALYQYTIKGANSMISQFSDDDLGTATGVNLAVHGLRLDIGLTRYLQWQHLVFIQDAKSASDPLRQFYVPVQRGSATTFRYFDQVLFTF